MGNFPNSGDFQDLLGRKIYGEFAEKYSFCKNSSFCCENCVKLVIHPTLTILTNIAIDCAVDFHELYRSISSLRGEEVAKATKAVRIRSRPFNKKFQPDFEYMGEGNSINWNFKVCHEQAILLYIMKICK